MHISDESTSENKLSYKFQRLREKLRTAIASGELAGKLPGERQLAKRFHVNAKTLSKALTDLAAEGLLDRSIGRGTFVKGSGGAAAAVGERWMIICDPGHENSPLISQLQQTNDNLLIVNDILNLRPSAFQQIRAVIVISRTATDSFLRSLVVRNIPVVLVGREPTTYSVNAVLMDNSLGVSCLAREMLLLGHRRFVAVEQKGQSAIAEIVRRAAQRFAPDASVDSVSFDDVPTALEHGGSAIICDSAHAATQVREILRQRNVSVPQDISIGAIGSSSGPYACTGYFLSEAQEAETIIGLIRDPQAKRPTTIWLTGALVENGTIAEPSRAIHPDVMHADRAFVARVAG